ESGRGVVLGLKAFDGLHRSAGAGVGRGAEAGEQRVFLVGGVPRGGLAEVAERHLEPLAGPRGERSVGALVCDAQERVEETLDAPVAGAEEPEGRVEAVLGPGAEGDGHGSASAAAEAGRAAG